MARHGERLPYASLSGEPAQIAMSAAQWRDLEAALCRPVLLGAREAFQALCNDYLLREQLEQAAIRVAEVRRCAESVNVLLTPLLQFSFGQPLIPKGVSQAAWDEFQSQFDEALSDFAIPLGQGISGDDGNAPARAVPLSRSIVMEVATRISAALAKIQSDGGVPDTFRDSDGTEVGVALHQFIVRAKAWAKDNGLPHGSMRSLNDTAAPFAAFLHHAIRLMPADIVPSISSAEAMAARILRSTRGN
jgi:hypothetical protein